MPKFMAKTRLADECTLIVGQQEITLISYPNNSEKYEPFIRSVVNRGGWKVVPNGKAIKCFRDSRLGSGAMCL